MTDTKTDTTQSAVYLVKDSGIRCLTKPCPVYLAVRADQPGDAGIKITDLDLSALALDEDKHAQLLSTTHKASTGLKVEATVSTVANAGPGGAATILRVRRTL